MPTVIDRHGVQQLVQQGAQLVDVLGAAEYEAEHIPGAINIPLKKLDRATTKRLDSRRPVITYCHDYQWDMSARAASRLERLGFTVYRYQAGRADWFAAGLTREGRDANVPRVADVAKRDLQTCRLDERLGDVRDRVDGDAGEPLIIVDSDRVVLGLVNAEALASEPMTPFEEVMDPGPVTFRPNLRTGQVPDYFKKQGIRHALVTTSDGVLIGLLRLHPGHDDAWTGFCSHFAPTPSRNRPKWGKNGASADNVELPLAAAGVSREIRGFRFSRLWTAETPRPIVTSARRWPEPGARLSSYPGNPVEGGAMSINNTVARALVLSALAVMVLAGAASALEVGQKAPEFALNGTDGKPVKLSDLTAKGPVVIYTFIAAFTPT